MGPVRRTTSCKATSLARLPAGPVGWGTAGRESAFPARRGTRSAERPSARATLLSANGDAGIYLIASGATGNLIQGNNIGTDVTGTLALGNTYEGIYAERAPSNTIGGAVPGAGNLISGNHTRGIWLTNASWNMVQGNLIGTKSDGISGLGNTFHGVECEVGACNNTIGGSGGAGNRIAFAQTVYAGVRIRDGSTNNAILGNAIFSNGALGIDLGAVGANREHFVRHRHRRQHGAELPGPDAGCQRERHRHPRARLTAGLTPCSCSNSSPIPRATLPVSGRVRFTSGRQALSPAMIAMRVLWLPSPESVPVGYSITATATDSANNTSEFSACFPVAPVPLLSVSPATNQQVTLAWTNTTTGFVLKQTSSLSPPVQWTAVTNHPVVTNGQFVVTLSAATGNRFYVLSFR